MKRIALVAVLVLLGLGAAQQPRAAANDPTIGINVVLDRPVTQALLDELEHHAHVLDVLPQVRGVTVAAKESDLASIRGLDFVAAACADRPVEFASEEPLPVPDLSGGATQWSLDAVNVMDAGDVRTVTYDGEGVYVAVIDTGLPHNWRAYFPEERIATGLARSFDGGGGRAHVISSQPEKWERDTGGHGTTVASVILGFAYQGSDDALPESFGGVAPKATVIPIRYGGSTNQSDHSDRFHSLAAHAIVYATDLKVDGVLGDAPLVINASWGTHEVDPLVRAAIDYAIENGVIFVAAAGNEASQGMRWPAAYPEVISVAATGWIGQFPADDATTARWILDDVPEDDASVHFVAPFSSQALDGQELDVAAPGFPIPVPWTINGKVAYTFIAGTSQACPHVAGIVAMMLQKNPTLVQADVEAILEASAMALPDGQVTVPWPSVKNYSNPGNGSEPTWEDHDRVSFFDLTFSWSGPERTGAGLVLADAALAATPNP